MTDSGIWKPKYDITNKVADCSSHEASAMHTDDFDRLVDDALNAHFEGWDFSCFAGRWASDPLPWDYRDRLLSAIPQAQSMLDVGTGGGEFLQSLVPLPALTIATEGYPPNVTIARERLGSLGIEVVDTSSNPSPDHLPFAGDAFDLIIDRHTGVSAHELWRCLRQGGSYIAQQVGGQDCAELREWFGDTSYASDPPWGLQMLAQQLTDAGFTMVDALEAYPKCVYKDIGAVVYHLKAIPWLIPSFDVHSCRDQLLGLHRYIEQHGGFAVRRHRFLIHAVKRTPS